jgi:predicted ATP-grasp superfamily ATP-dependent carboligase
VPGPHTTVPILVVSMPVFGLLGHITPDIAVKHLFSAYNCVVSVRNPIIAINKRLITNFMRIFSQPSLKKKEEIFKSWP